MKLEPRGQESIEARSRSQQISRRSSLLKLLGWQALPVIGVAAFVASIIITGDKGYYFILYIIAAFGLSRIGCIIGGLAGIASRHGPWRKLAITFAVCNFSYIGLCIAWLILLIIIDPKRTGGGP